MESPKTFNDGAHNNEGFTSQYAIQPHPFDLSLAVETLRSLSSYSALISHPTLSPDILEWKYDAEKETQDPTLNLVFSQPSHALVGTAFSNTLSVHNIPTNHLDVLVEESSSTLLEIPATVTPIIPDKIALSKKKKKKLVELAQTPVRKHRIHSFTPDFRRADLIDKLSLRFDDFLPRLAHLQDEVKLARRSPPIHIFVDHSNILIGFYETLKSYYGNRRNDRIRFPTISFQNLSIVLERGRQCDKRVLVGSTRHSPSVSVAETLGYETSMLYRVRKEDEKGTEFAYSSAEMSCQPAQTKIRSTEQGVDEILIMKILESLLDYSPSRIVLATGDGNVAEFSGGFYAAVVRSLYYGWKVELLSFKRNLNRRWKEIRHENFQIILLDDFLLNLIDSGQ